MIIFSVYTEVWASIRYHSQCSRITNKHDALHEVAVYELLQWNQQPN